MRDVAAQFARLVGLELRRSWILTTRYRVDSALSVGLLVLLFYGLLFGTRSAALGTYALGSGNEGLLLGFSCWVLATGGVSHVAHDIEEEAKTGTLEPLFLGVPGPGTVFMARNVAAMLAGVPVLLLVATALALATRSVFHVCAAALLPLLSLDMAASGIGFALGALAILVKRVRIPVVLAQLVVVGMLVSHIEGPGVQQLLAWLPIAPALHALRRLLLSGASLTPGTCVLLVANGMAWLAIGFGLFQLSIRRARALGLLAQH